MKSLRCTRNENEASIDTTIIVRGNRDVLLSSSQDERKAVGLFDYHGFPIRKTDHTILFNRIGSSLLEFFHTMSSREITTQVDLNHVWSTSHDGSKLQVYKTKVSESRERRYGDEVSDFLGKGVLGIYEARRMIPFESTGTHGMISSSDVDRLKEELSLLRDKRRDLDEELESLKTNEFGFLLWKAFQEHPIEKIEETHSETLNEVQERRLERVVNAYRLTGRTIFEHQEDLAVRLDVAYKGNYCETKYIFLRRSSRNHHLYVWKHTIPSFIPVKELEVQLLKETNLMLFLDRIESLLVGYFGRREQIYTIQTMKGIQGVEMTPEASKVQFLATHKGKRVFVLIKFHEDDGLTVNEAIVCDENPQLIPKAHRLPNLEILFKDTELDITLDSLFSQGLLDSVNS